MSFLGGVISNRERGKILKFYNLCVLGEKLMDLGGVEFGVGGGGFVLEWGFCLFWVGVRGGRNRSFRCVGRRVGDGSGISLFRKG